MNDFPYLFSSIQINRLDLKNRIVMTAMHLGYTPQGEVTERLIEFYRLRARGGVGLIIVGGCPIDPYSSMVDMIGIHDNRFIPGLSRLTAAIKTEGSKIAAQLYQAGRYVHSSMIGGKKPFSASAVRSRLTGETPRALALEEIPGVQDKFAEAAIRAQQAGFDAVEVLGSAGYLISQFFSPLTNRREDPYGGSPENRMRFGIEVVEKVRAAVGPDYPISMRLAGNDFMEGGNTNKEARLFAVELEKAGVDLFNVTGGWHETRIPQLSTFVPRKGFTYLAQGIKASVTVPVLSSNRINDPWLAEEILRAGEADLVTMARALLADPELPYKTSLDKTERIYHCVACNQGCFDNIFRREPVTCLVNPRAGLENELQIAPTKKRKKVLVIGGGPAGMKAACIAAERGHQVVLVEQNNILGGQLLLNQNIPGREELVTAARDLDHNVQCLPVKIMLGQTADYDFIKKAGPDAIVLATGAKPFIPPIQGIDDAKVIPAWDLLREKIKVGKQVVIIGGNAVGLETALFLARQGTITPELLHFLVRTRAESWETLQELVDKGNKDVTVVEMRSKVGEDIGGSTRWTIMAELSRLGVKIMTHTEALEVTPEGVKVQKAGIEHFLPAHSVVLATGARAENRLLDEVKDLVPEMHVIGDAKSPRNALEAIKEGFLTGLKI
jgi:2,4-dienoyl-CoA reductase (NADPH2)